MDIFDGGIMSEALIKEKVGGKVSMDSRKLEHIRTWSSVFGLIVSVSVLVVVLSK